MGKQSKHKTQTGGTADAEPELPDLHITDLGNGWNGVCSHAPFLTGERRAPKTRPPSPRHLACHRRACACARRRRGPADPADASHPPAPRADFLCPISGRQMIDPVEAADGFTYERTNIEAWVQANPKRSPVRRPRRLHINWRVTAYQLALN